MCVDHSFLLIALTTDNIPVRFPFGPSLSGIGSRRFAFLMKLEPKNTTARLEGAHACTVGTLHMRDTTLLELLEINGNSPSKCALGRLSELRQRLLAFSL